MITSHSGIPTTATTNSAPQAKFSNIQVDMNGPPVHRGFRGDSSLPGETSLAGRVGHILGRNYAAGMKSARDHCPASTGGGEITRTEEERG